MKTALRRRRWVIARAASAAAAILTLALAIFAWRWHLGRNYYGYGGAAFTQASIVVEVFTPPLQSPHRLGGHDVSICRTQFFSSTSRLRWLPSWRSSGPPLPLTRVIFPLWIPAALFATAAWIAHRRIRAIDRIGLCPSCRYDRRTLPAEAPCPECGNRPPAS